MIPAPKATDSLVDLAELWLEDEAGRLARASRALRRGRHAVRSFMRSTGARTIADLSPRAVLHWITERGREVGPKAIRNDLAAIRGFADWLVVVELWKHNPLRSIRLPRCPARRGSEPFSFDEAVRLLATVMLAAESPDGRTREPASIRWRFYLFLLRTGLRWNEARTQRWDDLDLDRGTLTVTQAKTLDRARIPLDGESLAMLRDWRTISTGDLVFESIPSHRVLERDMRAAGIPEAPGQWHRFRKFAVTERARRGVSMRELCALARHRDIKMTAGHYDYVKTDEVRRAAESLPSLTAAAPAVPLPSLSKDDAELVASPGTLSIVRRAMLDEARRRVEAGELPGVVASEMRLADSTCYRMRAAARGQSFRTGKNAAERPVAPFLERKKPDESAIAGAGESCPVRKKSDGADDDRKAGCFPKRKKSGGAAGGGKKETFPVRKKTAGAGAGSQVESFPSRKKSGRVAVAAKAGIVATPKGRSGAAAKTRGKVAPVAGKRGGR